MAGGGSRRVNWMDTAVVVHHREARERGHAAAENLASHSGSGSWACSPSWLKFEKLAGPDYFLLQRAGIPHPE